jgi:hypothetical protein
MYMPEQALTLARGWGSHNSRQSAHAGGKVVSPTHWPPLPPVFLALISIGGRIEPRAIVRPEGLCKWKIPTTYHSVAQCLNQLPHRVPRDSWGTNYTWDRFFTERFALSSHYCFTKAPSSSRHLCDQKTRWPSTGAFRISGSNRREYLRIFQSSKG